MLPRDFTNFAADPANLNIKNHQDAILKLSAQTVTLGKCGSSRCCINDWKKDAKEADIKNALQNKWDSSSAMKTMACLVRQIFAQFVLDQSVGWQDPPVLNNRLNSYFPVSKLINYDSSSKQWTSADGIATIVDLVLKWLPGSPRIQNFALMKLQQPGASPQEELLHETAVGLVLNGMRDYLPCFMYVYGGFFCGYPTDASMQTKNFNDLCKNNADMHTCMLSEFVPNIGDISKFWFNNSISDDDKERVFLLTCFALAEANRRYGFVHGDLHFGNIMIRELSAPRLFTFKFAGKVISITTKYLPTVIDYGRSQINFQGKKLTPIFRPSYPPALKFGHSADFLVADGKASMDGYDLIRLVTSFNFPTAATADINKLLNDCFYGGLYDFTSVFPGTLVGHLDGTPGNERKFRDATLVKTNDPNNNPLCTKGFLHQALDLPKFKILCGLVSDSIELKYDFQITGETYPIVLLKTNTAALGFYKGTLYLEDRSGNKRDVQTPPASASGPFVLKNDASSQTLSLISSSGVYKSWSYSGYSPAGLVLRNNGVLKIKGTTPTGLVDVQVLYHP